MEGIAFVVGVSQYNDPKLNNLTSPAKDATDLAQVLSRLKYDVICSIDEEKDVVDNKWNEFKLRIQSEDHTTSIVFFSGHGMHVNNSECLFLRDATPPNSQTDSRAKAKSLILKDLMDELDALELPIKIFIIDACRTMPAAKGSVVRHGLNLSEITRQTFVAYASAIGMPAQDGDPGKNSVFTEALLNYIGEEQLSIEHLFKKVRQHLIEKSIDQTPWEHTCLVADFAFNHGQLSKYYKSPYSEAAFKTTGYHGQNETEDRIVTGLKSDNASDIRESLKLINSNFRTLSPEFKFVTGRLISSQATKGNRECLSFIDNVSKIKTIDANAQGSMLKGIFYNLYFDDNDRLREQISGNIEYLNAIERLRLLADDKEVENFVGNLIHDAPSRILYRIGSPMIYTVRCDLEETGVEDDSGASVMYLKRIYVPNLGIEMSPDFSEPIIDREKLRKLISRTLHLPIQTLKMNMREEDVYTRLDFDDLDSHINTSAETLQADEIDTLSSNSYIESVENIQPRNITKERGTYYIKGDCTLTVHMEFDREEMASMTFPSQFSVKMDRDRRGYHFGETSIYPDTTSYYE